ncbi:MAG: hypothetical protein M0Z79_03795 [Nitrospiraceae bacterium]|nr:hypothetical protein [Nitrospiraceae bacterium]
MGKKVAVIVTDNQREGVRMSVGLTLEDCAVSVFIMDKKLESDEEIDLNVETLGDMDGKIYSNTPENSFEQKTVEEIARILPEFDAVIHY